MRNNYHTLTHWLSLKPVYTNPMVSSVSWQCLCPFFALHACKGSHWASSSATHFTRFTLNLFHSLDTDHVACLLFLARSVNCRDILCLWTFTPPNVTTLYNYSLNSHHPTTSYFLRGCTLRIRIIILGSLTNLKGCRGPFVLSFTPCEKQLPYPRSLDELQLTELTSNFSNIGNIV